MPASQAVLAVTKDKVVDGDKPASEIGYPKHDSCNWVSGEGNYLIALAVFATVGVITAVEVENKTVKEQIDQIAEEPQITPFPTRSRHNKLGEASSKPHKAHTYHSRCTAKTHRCCVRSMLEDDAGFCAHDGFRHNNQRGAQEQFALHRSRLRHLYRPVNARMSDIKGCWGLRHVCTYFFPTAGCLNWLTCWY